LPSWKTNIIEDWEIKLDKIVEETKDQNMTLISGIPPWMQMYFDRLTEKTNKKPGELFPNFSVMVYGGVNFAPYKDKLFSTIGRLVDSIETFPASEGFFAFQDRQNDNGLQIQLDSGIFYEFVPVNELGSANPTRLTIAQVELNVNYALVISSNAGLWAYNIGDTVKFVSLFPHKIIVTGRVKHFISAFGEHVIAEEVEKSMSEVASREGIKVIEFTVAPQVNPGNGELPYHEWFVEFESVPHDFEKIKMELDQQMQRRNIYYKDLIEGNIIQPLVITPIERNGFVNYMKSIGKLGGQNKLPRLSNDRKIADAIEPFILKGIHY
jgi:hypothetical protein